MHVLMADTDRSAVNVASVEVRKAGHEFFQATSFQQLERIMNEKAGVDLLLLNEDLAGDSFSEVDRIHDRWPNTSVYICTRDSSVDSAVEAMRHTADGYLQKPFAQGELASLFQKVKKKETDHSAQSGSTPTQQTIVDLLFKSKNPELQNAYDIAFKAAKTDASILLLGPSGTGKSVLAKEIHQRSARSDKPCVTVHCPSLSRELLESELFGHVKGAFTGAVSDTWGKVHAADGGTLFLDEIGDMQMEIQPKLLRLLQEMRYERLGETTVRKADIRVIAATNQDIARRVTEGAIREDLLYRLNVISVHLPPIKDRVEDLPDLIEHFRSTYAEHHGRQGVEIDDEAKDMLMQYDWPGNLREMGNVLERAVILADDEKGVTADCLPSEISHSEQPTPKVGSKIPIEELEEAHIRKILERCDNLEEAADILGIDTATLYRKRKKIGLLD